VTKTLSSLARRAACIWACALAAAATLVFTPTANAQPGRGMFGGLDEPTINSKEIERYGELLKLTPDQLESAKSMLEGFNGDFNSIRQEMRQAFESMRNEAQDSGDNSLWRNAPKLMSGFQQKVEKIEKQYFDDLKLLLTDDQAAKWPAVERAHRREKSAPRGGLVSGETVDLIKIVHDLKSLTDADRQAVQPLLDQYEGELDRALTERDKAYQEGMEQGMQLWMNQQMDKIEALFSKSRDAAAKVKDVNKRFARQVGAGLPEKAQPDFEKEVKKASFPRVYRATFATRALDTALGLGDLSEDQKTQLTTIKTSFETQLSGLQEKQAASIEETEMKRTAMQMFGMGGGGNDGSQEVRDQRRELESATYDKVKAVLNEAQQAKLPEKPQQGNWRRMLPGGGGGTGGGQGAGRSGS